ncbi:dimethyl sulfoxide reductase anchor subunit family protein [Pseudodesulfovibrio piezophilus]|uniref:Molybdopterin-containing oxidoreductase membrane anchor subunit n=1 Tax=Pseudodesulfovibrio piezophilus (strain DSM 21447 / JCM 15486 / C1TLV30) TaxID=1322246 RepID=M1WJS6_PSEP2|nr:DmsC/YnfH family molybdoenzyme membrane anchor subunit [Pseudodesulfovibrio piezophilus]CCH48411.1 Molybdopterin-containing oxidoreductase membrane anchor subunit [Pseudodesulfovibrio piezophilus C1TLV30]
MQSFELPLVFFTVLSQAAIGIALTAAVRARGGVDSDNAQRQWRMTAGLMVVGLIASLFHLGHPTGAPNALKHLSTAWLSREVLSAGLFVGLAILAAFSVGKKGNPVLALLGAVLGLVVIFSTGMTYAPPAYPAVNNALPATFFLTTAVILGAGFASWFAGGERQPLLARIFTTGLVVGVVLYLVAPCVWLSGGKVMRLTGQAWFASGLYWTHVGVLVVSLAVMVKTRTIPVWLPILVLFGELAGRAGFFVDTIHTAANMGALY